VNQRREKEAGGEEEGQEEEGGWEGKSGQTKAVSLRLISRAQCCIHSGVSSPNV